jgi:hypothetical protein
VIDRNLADLVEAMSDVQNASTIAQNRGDLVGLQALVVSIGLIIAFAAGILAGTWEVAAAGFAGWLAIGWSRLYLTERIIGREISHYTAPYPYRWMQVTSVSETSRLQTAPERELRGVEAEDIRLAA